MPERAESTQHGRRVSLRGRVQVPRWRAPARCPPGRSALSRGGARRLPSVNASRTPDMLSVPPLRFPVGLALPGAPWGRERLGLERGWQRRSRVWCPGVEGRGHLASFAVGRLGRQSLWRWLGEAAPWQRQGTHGRFVEPHNFARLADRLRSRFAWPCSPWPPSRTGSAPGSLPVAGVRLSRGAVQRPTPGGGRLCRSRRPRKLVHKYWRNPSTWPVMRVPEQPGALRLVCSHTFGFGARKALPNSEIPP